MIKNYGQLWTKIKLNFYFFHTATFRHFFAFFFFFFLLLFQFDFFNFFIVLIYLLFIWCFCLFLFQTLSVFVSNRAFECSFNTLMHSHRHCHRYTDTLLVTIFKCVDVLINKFRSTHARCIFGSFYSKWSPSVVHSGSCYHFWNKVLVAVCTLFRIFLFPFFGFGHWTMHCSTLFIHTHTENKFPTIKAILAFESLKLQCYLMLRIDDIELLFFFSKLPLSFPLLLVRSKSHRREKSCKLVNERNRTLSVRAYVNLLLFSLNWFFNCGVHHRQHQQLSDTDHHHHHYQCKTATATQINKMQNAKFTITSAMCCFLIVGEKG